MARAWMKAALAGMAIMAMTAPVHAADTIKIGVPGAHSGDLVSYGMPSLNAARIVADEYRTALIARMGLLGWKGLIAVLSLLGFVLLVYGYGAARAEPVMLWSPPPWTKHLTALLTLPAS